MSESTVLDLKTCPSCGADCDARDARCWLCHADVTPGGGEIVDAVVVQQSPHYAPTETLFAVMAGILAVLIVLVGIGSALSEPGMTVLLLIVVVPALVATLVRIQARKGRVGHVGWGEKLATFVISASITVGLLGMLGVAAIVALVAFCFYTLATQNVH
ncbi:MAG: hypothetical protein RIC55_26625 [Pirellulaceae bacterium]